ncbi:alkane hydroxylase MAH1-like [Hordeum vulgare subsp. vulgare]|uniref:alkane hydroxylase MAH1-like n=1 Tax=Hordeum vulgare subsp. vulgare TaxID=112509 RepID=UPI001D1A3839|nr:alkane hydroxylase MAH1-like [Hordeum vulgare subsp. vulgare]
MLISLFSQELLFFTVVVPFVFVYLCYRSSSISKNTSAHATNWPIFHMLPALIVNLYNIHDCIAAVLAQNSQNTRIHLPGRRIFMTCDPANVRHIFTTNYTNFPKGMEFAAIFDIMDRTLFTIDGEPARRQRAKLQSVLSSPQLVASMAACCRNKLENGLLPFFTDMASTNAPFDMQEVISRFIFDLAAMPIFGVDPGLVSSDMLSVEVAMAMDTVMEVGFIRHMMPDFCWKAMRRLNIGPERKLHAAHTVLQGFIKNMIESKKIKGGCICNREEQQGVDILSSYVNDPDYSNDGLFRAMLGFMFAGRDTIGTILPWIFYNLAQNPNIVSVIRNELSPIASRKIGAGRGAIVIFEPEEIKSLVYLQATLFETLRLYPPAPFERKTVVADDIMPSGHKVKAGDTIFISVHSMGRMEDVWGKDCHDYNPYRWISEDNKLCYVPSHKFLSFNSGPRTCLGKDIAIMQMKTVVAAVLWNFDMEVVQGQSIQPKMSCILHMKNGLIVKLKKR